MGSAQLCVQDAACDSRCATLLHGHVLFLCLCCCVWLSVFRMFSGTFLCSKRPKLSPESSLFVVLGPWQSSGLVPRQSWLETLLFPPGRNAHGRWRLTRKGVNPAEDTDSWISRRTLRADFCEVERAHSSASAELSAIFGSLEDCQCIKRRAEP